MIHTQPPAIIRPFINFAVALFLFLSGYLTPVNINDIFKFYKKRIFRVLIPYLIWTLIYTIAHLNFDRLFVNLITTRASVAFYYIFVYIQFVLITPFLKKMACSKFRWVGWLISPVSTVVFRYIPDLMGVEMNSYVSILWNISCLGWFTYYYLGILLGNHIIKTSYSTKKLCVFYFFTLVLQMLEDYGLKMLSSSISGSQIKLTAFLSSSVFLLILYNYLEKPDYKLKDNFAVKILLLIGDCSFGIYLSHILLRDVLYRITLFSKIPFCLNSILVLLISFLFVLVASKICGKKLSRYLGLN